MNIIINSWVFNICYVLINCSFCCWFPCSDKPFFVLWEPLQVGLPCAFSKESLSCWNTVNCDIMNRIVCNQFQTKTQNMPEALFLFYEFLWSCFTIQ
jgi:hypothetical protein